MGTLWEKTCMVFDSISATRTFTIETCQENFNVQSIISNGDSKIVLCSLKCKICGEAPNVGKAKTKFLYRLNNHKSKHRVFREGKQKILHTYYYIGVYGSIDGWDFIIFEQCKTHAQLKETFTFWRHRLKNDRSR